jgi:hypothetical protein
LEDYGVDLVLSGHSHVYERSFLLDGHYGYSWDYGPEMALDSSLGREDAAGPYRKPAGGSGSNRGAVYVVCGCSGEGGSPEDFPRHPAMALNHGGFGSMVIEIDGLKLKASFLRPTGEYDDHFTIDKSEPLTNGPSLRIARGTNGPVLIWPTSQPAFELQSAQTLRLPEWRTATNPVIITGRGKQAVVGETTNTFFRLRSVP